MPRHGPARHAVARVEAARHAAPPQDQPRHEAPRPPLVPGSPAASWVARTAEVPECLAQNRRARGGTRARVGNLRRSGAGGGQEVDIPTRSRDNRLVKTNRPRRRSPRGAWFSTPVAHDISGIRTDSPVAQPNRASRGGTTRDRRVIRSHQRPAEHVNGRRRSRHRPSTSPAGHASAPASRNAAASSSYRPGAAAMRSSLFSRPPPGPPMRAPASRAMRAPAA